MSERKLLKTAIEYMKGVGPQRADMLKKELSIFNFGDFLMQFPFRYVDKTQFHRIADIDEETENIQLKGVLRRLETVGDGRKKRLVGRFRDASGVIDLVWFKGAKYIEKQLQIGGEYVVYGKPNFFKSYKSIPHPEIELLSVKNAQEASSLDPVYSTTEKLKARGLDVKPIRKLKRKLVEAIQETDVPENLPEYIRTKLKLPSRYEALKHIHFPPDARSLKLAQNRLKFEELFFLQIKLLQTRGIRKDTLLGYHFEKVGDAFNGFYKQLPFELTNAQKRVIKEIRRDVATNRQMNRLVQGDVGSGKTICALMTMLLAIDNGFQACLMAPTSILAQQHFNNIKKDLEGLDINVAFLSGSIKGKKKRGKILSELADGTTQILIGTHALIEDPVVFKNLGLAIIDEQHRFGVAQRAKLWRKSKPYPPHVLVMTATPIPRTLAMTAYGDLDVSVIDEMPPGRKPVKTIHKTEAHRLRVFGFMKEEIKKGRQVYIVYPLIEESETLDLNNLMEGYESISREFPIPDYQISIVHGRMKPADKDFEMQRFARNETQIMVATTVIEVGVNVPNATLMIIENTERFGLAQLHQLRGRVGRGGGDAYCILMSSYKLSTESRHRIKTMCDTNDGFKIAEEDMKLRGPGNITGTQQSGILHLRIADLVKDNKILVTAREIAKRVLDDDLKLERPEHQPIKVHLASNRDGYKGWSRIS
ncbi:MAG: ATP-dependent DNA helicase RecG [Saprospiraceae bacterium]